MHACLEPQRGFALVTVLILLVVLYAGALGVFVAARAELHAGSNQAAAERVFHAVEGGLASWLADPVQPASAGYDIGPTPVRVVAQPLLTVDSATSLYRIVATVAPGAAPEVAFQAVASRTVTMIGRRSGLGAVEPVGGTWRERF